MQPPVRRNARVHRWVKCIHTSSDRVVHMYARAIKLPRLFPLQRFAAYCFGNVTLALRVARAIGPKLPRNFVHYGINIILRRNSARVNGSKWFIGLGWSLLLYAKFVFPRSQFWHAIQWLVWLKPVFLYWTVRSRMDIYKEFNFRLKE